MLLEENINYFKTKMLLEEFLIFTRQLPKARIEFVEVFPAGSTSFASRVVGPF